MAKEINFFNIFGKQLTCVDGWNGNLTHITIESVTHVRDNSGVSEFKFTGRGYHGNEQNIWVPAALVSLLFSEGQAHTTYTIDHCTFNVEYRFINAE